MQSLIVFLLTYISIPAFATQQCMDFFIKETQFSESQYAEIHVTAESLTSSQVDEMKEVILAINQMIQGKLSIPDVNFIFLKKDHAPTYTYEKATLVAPYQLVIKIKRKIFAVSFANSRAVLAHEYAHAILEEIFYESNAAALQAFDKQTNALSRELEAKLKGLSKAARNKYFDSKEYSDWAERESIAANKEEKIKNKIKYRFASYGELFADLVGVLYAKDGQAIYKGVTPEGLSAQEISWLNQNAHKNGHKDYDFSRDVAARDFMREHPIADWQKSEKHLYFAPVRSFLGRFLFSSSSYIGQEGNIIVAVYNAIQSEMIYAFEHLQTEDDNHTEANARLIHAIQKNLSKFPQAQ